MALERLAALGIPKPQRLAVVELQYRGTMWTQLNGKDWKVEAFLVSENGGLGLEVGPRRLPMSSHRFQKLAASSLKLTLPKR
jgi:hypothetical protein